MFHDFRELRNFEITALGSCGVIAYPHPVLNLASNQA